MQCGVRPLFYHNRRQYLMYTCIHDKCNQLYSQLHSVYTKKTTTLTAFNPRHGMTHTRTHKYIAKAVSSGMFTLSIMQT